MSCCPSPLQRHFIFSTSRLYLGESVAVVICNRHAGTYNTQGAGCWLWEMLNVFTESLVSNRGCFRLMGPQPKKQTEAKPLLLMTETPDSLREKLPSFGLQGTTPSYSEVFFTSCPVLPPSSSLTLTLTPSLKQNSQS